MSIAANPNDAASRRRLQLQLLIVRRAGRDVAGIWLPIAADPDDTAGRRRLQLQLLIVRRAAATSAAPGSQPLQIRMTRPAAGAFSCNCFVPSR
ncbi:hypothetical protein ACFSR7_05815 [Cohnella sp. GCM10020058]|uniref:hypothetical protein n=1 Tax=Cohnella sp. GCM10020058 TaxID=3317330 RepID=UPI00363E3E07